MKSLLGLATAAFLSLFAGAAHADYALGPHMTRFPTEQIAHNAWIEDCFAFQAQYDAAGFPKGDNIATIRRIDRLVKSRMSYRADRSGQERWDSHLIRILNGDRRIVGDCDDYTLTAMTMAICAGVPADRIEFATSQTRAGKLSLDKMDHAVAIYTDPTGAKHVFGDTMNAPHGLRTRDRVVLKISAKEIGRAYDMIWHSTIPIRGAQKIEGTAFSAGGASR